MGCAMPSIPAHAGPKGENKTGVIQLNQLKEEYTMHRRMLSLVFAGLLIAGTLGACTAAPPPAPQVVEKVVTSVVEKENVVTKVQTQVVEKEKVVVATPVPAGPGPKTV